ncbi:hypothetical protein HPP92_010920, partial [Vanilla planifolia]
MHCLVNTERNPRIPILYTSSSTKAPLFLFVLQRPLLFYPAFCLLPPASSLLLNKALAFRPSTNEEPCLKQEEEEE